MRIQKIWLSMHEQKTARKKKEVQGLNFSLQDEEDTHAFLTDMLEMPSTASSALTSTLPQAPRIWSPREEEWLFKHKGTCPWSELANRFQLKFQMVRSLASMTNKIQNLNRSAANGSAKQCSNSLWTAQQDRWLVDQNITNEFRWQDLADAYAGKYPRRTVKALKMRKKRLFNHAQLKKDP